MKSRVASVLVVAGLVLGGTAGVVVAGGGVHGSGGSSDSASHSQYCPPSSHGDYHSHDCGHPNPGGGGDHGGGHGGDHGGHGGDHH